MLNFENEYAVLMKDIAVLNKTIAHPQMRNDFGAILTRDVPKFDQSASSDAEAIAGGIQQFGFHMLPSLSKSEVQEVNTALSGKPMYDAEFEDWTNIKDRKQFTEDTRPNETLLARHNLEDVIRCKPLVKITTNPALISAITKHMGCTPTISTIQVWHTFPGEKEVAAEMFHRDRPCFKFAKLFMYLTDVDSDSGPHQFVQHSHSIESIQKFLLPKHPGLDINSLFSDGRGAEVTKTLLNKMGNDVITFTGPAGTSFIEYTYGLHRGTRPAKSKRTIFSVTYTGLPLRFGNDTDRHLEMGRNLTFADAGISNPTDLEKYMFRFYLA